MPTVNPKLFPLRQAGGKTVKTGWFHAFWTLFWISQYPIWSFRGLWDSTWTCISCLVCGQSPKKGPQAQWPFHPWIHFCQCSIANLTSECKFSPTERNRSRTYAMAVCCCSRIRAKHFTHIFYILFSWIGSLQTPVKKWPEKLRRHAPTKEKPVETYLSININQYQLAFISINQHLSA